ncbi:cyclophilin-like fold protein [Trichococcus patagoniensis]|nr:cyclophilin-like fold protein [Trichococcus patagoniensis]
MRKRILLTVVLFAFGLLAACFRQTSERGETDLNSRLQDSQSSENDSETGGNKMQIQVKDEIHTVVFMLNNSVAAESLYNQLPFKIRVENYGNNEKIFYPPTKLNTTDTPSAEGPAGTLAYFEPWGNVVMYYGSFGRYRGLYDLGTAISGGEHIRKLTGEISVTKISE